MRDARRQRRRRDDETTRDDERRRETTRERGDVMLHSAVRRRQPGLSATRLALLAWRGDVKRTPPRKRVQL